MTGCPAKTVRWNFLHRSGRGEVGRPLAPAAQETGLTTERTIENQVMKTKQTWTMLAVQLGLLVCAQTATAFYNPSTGRWLSRDPVENTGGVNLHSFIAEDPVNKVDRFGLQELREQPILHVSTATPQPAECGAFSWLAIWVLDPAHPSANPVSGGLIVQYVSATFDIAQDAEGTPAHLGPPRAHPLYPEDWPFYEAWHIPPGRPRPSNGYDDLWAMPSFEGTKGTFTIVAQADYYDGADIPWNFVSGGAGPGSNQLPTSGYFIPPGASTSTVSRSLTASWNCLCDAPSEQRRTRLSIQTPMYTTN